VENEAWDGSIERIVKIIDVIKHDDMEDEVAQTPIISQDVVTSTPWTAPQIPTYTTLVKFPGV